MAREALPKCPQCASPMVRRKGSRGEFYGCSRYSKGCRGTRDIIKYPDLNPADLAPGSPQQQDIWSFLANGTENALVEARAGSGKTYTITEGVYRLRGLKIAVFSFNAHIIREMNNKLKAKGINWVRGLTYNGFGYKCVKSAYPNSELYEDKLESIVSELFTESTDDGNIIRSATCKLTRLCKCYLEDGRDQESLSEMIERFNVDLYGVQEYDDDSYERRLQKVMALVPRALDTCLSRRTTIDFDDQVWFTVKLHLPVERFDMVLVDEAQDTNRMQQELIKMACP